MVWRADKAQDDILILRKADAGRWSRNSGSSAYVDANGAQGRLFLAVAHPLRDNIASVAQWTRSVDQVRSSSRELSLGRRIDNLEGNRITIQIATAQGNSKRHA